MAGNCLPPEGVALSARYRALDGPGALGGDFYARCENEQGTRVIIADVRGKGASAARKARLLASAFLLIAPAGSSLEDVSLALTSSRPPTPRPSGTSWRASGSRPRCCSRSIGRDAASR